MDPPPEGCPLCGSTWGNCWEEVQGRSTFFCCTLCAKEWHLLIAEVRRRSGWAAVDRIEVRGNRWGRTGEAQYEQQTLRFSVAFTPEGRLRRFERLDSDVAAPSPAEIREVSPPAPIAAEADPTAPSNFTETPEVHESEPVMGEPVAALEEPTPGTDALPPTPPPSAEFHEEIRAQIEHESETFPDVMTLSPEEGRKVVRQQFRETDSYAGTAPAVSQLKTTSFGPSGHRVPVRVYTPKDGEAPFPVIAYFHGGGWVFGDLDTHDSVCREIANRSRCVVASVGYRRAPEHKFPEPVEDCYAAVQWLADDAVAARLGTDATRIAVAGDSAGGNMAAVVCLIAKERGGATVAGQILICPLTAYRPTNESIVANAEGYGFEGSFLPWMWEQYLPGPESGKDPHVAPIEAADLTGLPPALVLTAQYDLLRDEGEAYARRLHDAGVRVQATRYPGMPHGFIDYRGLADEGWDALEEIGVWLRGLFNR